MGSFMLIRLVAYRNDVPTDLGGYASVEVIREGDLVVAVGHPGSYRKLSSDAAISAEWVTPDGLIFDRWETTTVTNGDGIDG